MKQIEEMAKDILEEYSYAYSEVDLEQLAKKLQAMRKETAREILQYLWNFDPNNLIEELAEEYGVEVE